MSEKRNPDIVQTPTGFKRKGAVGRPVDTQYEGGEFYRCYKLCHDMTIESLQQQLWKLGWPYERIVVRVLGWEEAVERLKDDAKAMLAMVRMVVVLEDQHGQLFLARTPDVVSGVKGIHNNIKLN